MNAIIWVIALIILAALLAAVELLLIPGFGVAGLLALAALAGAAALAFVQLGTLAGTLAITSGVGIAIILMWLLPKTRAARAMVLERQHERGAGDSGLESLLGQHGVTLTPMRPAGMVELAGRPMSVLTDGEYLERGTPVRVVKVEGGRIVVAPCPGAEVQGN